jgi:hypothetical protein
MTHEQSARESMEADKIRAMISKRSEENVSKSVSDAQNGPTSGWYGKAIQDVRDIGQDMKENSPASQAYESVRGAMADINRRVFEEPWFGKPVQDILFDRQQNPIDRDKRVDQEVGKQGTVHGEQKQQEAGKDNFWESFFGKNQAAEQEQQQGPELGR